MKKRKSLSAIIKTTAILVIFLLGAAGGYLYSQKQKPQNQNASAEKNAYLAFTSEVYKTIQENYWEKITDEQLTDLFQLGAEKLTSQPQSLESKDKAGLEKLLAKILKQIKTEEEKKEFTAQLADIVLANLKPFGRNRLYTKKEEENLKNRVQNVNPEVNQYQVLEVEKEATQKELEIAYQEKTKELEPKKDESPEAKKEYEQVQQAYKVLSDPDSREVYDVSGVEPTMDYQLIRPKIFHLHIKKFSPTTFDELKRVTEKVNDREGLDTLILDLRDNIGGSIDILPYFLGPFIGNDQYAYEFFHQGEKTPFKTKTGWLAGLVKYKKVVILINEGAQSSAEAMAAVLKKYNVGILVGAPTKGWGTVEKVFHLEQEMDENEKHSIFLVHSLVLREDGQPIEGKGVEPAININSPDWENQLLGYFNYQELVDSVKEILKIN